MPWRLVNSRGAVKILSDSDRGKIEREYYVVFYVCEKHRIVCTGKKAFVLHLQEEHAY